MRSAFLFAYALRSLRRSGQRSVLAVVCIAFGVLALVAMQLLAGAITRATVVAPELTMGGDLLLGPGSDADANVALLDSLVAERMLDAYVRTTFTQTPMVRSSNSGRVQFVGRSLGVDHTRWPITGDVILRDGVTVADALARTGDVIITRDIAAQLAAGRGDTLRIGGPGQASMRVVVSAVADMVPDREGQTLVFSLETARLLAGDAPLPFMTAAVYGPREGAFERLTAAGLQVGRAADAEPGSATRVFSMMLRGAGILGLLVGGIGVAYTLHVMLTRRRMEIATLRAIGYRTPQLMLLFGVEAAVLGAVGGALGTAAAIALSAQLTRLLGRVAGAMLLDPPVLTAGVLLVGPVVGVASAVLFGTAAIVRACGVRPGVLLRDMPVRATRAATAGAGGLYLLLAALFTALASAIMGSVMEGIGVVVLAAVGTVLLGALLAGMLAVVVRLPLPRLPLLNMARANLRTEPSRSAFALIALFVGVFAIGFASAAISSGSERVTAQRDSDGGYNLRVYAAPSDEPRAEGALAAAGATDVIRQQTVNVRTTSASGRVPALGTLDVMTAEDIRALLGLDSVAARPPEAGRPAAAYVPAMLAGEPWQMNVGDTLVVRAEGAGAADSLVIAIAGFQEAPAGEMFAAPRGIVMSREEAGAFAEAGTTAFVASVAVGDLAGVAAAVGSDLPESMLISRADMNDFLVTTYRNLFMFVAAIAGLALLAGVVLIANAVTLAMVERRRELGVLMAIGYTSRRVLRTILLENGTLGIVAGVAGVAAVHVMIAVLNARESALEMSFGLLPSLVMVGVALALAIGAAAAVAWGPVHVRPLEVLRSD